MLEGYINEENIKLLIIAAVYLTLFTIEHYAPYFKKRQHHLPHSLRNLVLAGINASISTLCFIVIIKHICSWAWDNQFGVLNQINLATAYSFILAIVLIDLWQYIWHRLNHEVAFLWKFHQVHHTDKDMDASTGLRFHPIEIIYSNFIRISIIPFLGLQLDHLLLYEILLLPIILFHHSNIILNENVDKILRIITVTPHIHRLHHSDIQSETDSNYASVFSIWDRLFRSYKMRPIEQAFNLGLGNRYSEKQWNSIYGMLAIPFLKKTS
jgi:sterol desaturase/sphingolipid hydroxylase (fatty acid hydroxylase superfamily)